MVTFDKETQRETKEDVDGQDQGCFPPVSPQAGVQLTAPQSLGVQPLQIRRWSSSQPPGTRQPALSTRPSSPQRQPQCLPPLVLPHFPAERVVLISLEQVLVMHDGRCHGQRQNPDHQHPDQRVPHHPDGGGLSGVHDGDVAVHGHGRQREDADQHGHGEEVVDELADEGAQHPVSVSSMGQHLGKRDPPTYIKSSLPETRRDEQRTAAEPEPQDEVFGLGEADASQNNGFVSKKPVVTDSKGAEGPRQPWPTASTADPDEATPRPHLVRLFSRDAPGREDNTFKDRPSESDELQTIQEHNGAASECGTESPDEDID
ncbi:uncharacterized protein LOC117513522 [Thalassophryne amazonica]|uniref:uncharacterized protein LOC117513522 n=1 Tax=Thalassophryne amazonica TaxID=390379 RepID=UPI0014721F06|nr:uncharacterized protein LOC117513522 [Thalassophryne amazonica]